MSQTREPSVDSIDTELTFQSLVTSRTQSGTRRGLPLPQAGRRASLLTRSVTSSVHRPVRADKYQQSTGFW